MYSHTSSFITICLYIHIVDAMVLEASPWRRVLSWNAVSRAGAAGQHTYTPDWWQWHGLAILMKQDRMAPHNTMSPSTPDTKASIRLCTPRLLNEYNSGPIVWVCSAVSLIAESGQEVMWTWSSTIKIMKSTILPPGIIKARNAIPHKVPAIAEKAHEHNHDIRNLRADECRQLQDV